VEGSIVVATVLENKDVNFGFDVQNEDYVVMGKAGIIDRPGSCAPRFRIPRPLPAC
jgi:hypothetical protein